jgi:hypothetical protein
MARPVRDPLPTDTPWVFRRITSRTNAAGRRGRLGPGAPPRVTSLRAKSGRQPERSVGRWSR